MTNILIGIVIFVFSVSFSTLIIWAVLEIAGNGKNSQSD